MAATTGIQVFGVQVEVLLREESTYRRRSARLIRAVRLFTRTFLTSLGSGWGLPDWPGRAGVLEVWGLWGSEAACRPRDEHQGGMEHDLSQQGLSHCHQEVADLQRHGGRRRGRGRRRGWGRRGECPGFNMIVLPNAELCGLWLAFLFQMVLYNVHMWYILNPWRVKSVERKDWKPPPFRDAIMHACMHAGPVLFFL